MSATFANWAGNQRCAPRTAARTSASLPGETRRRVDTLLGELDARVHWGKLHFLTPEQLRRRYPRAEAFIEIRRQFDQDGVFLNDHLRPLFA
jgi:FAD/FMN-containing dehydrogenase